MRRLADRPPTQLVSSNTYPESVVPTVFGPLRLRIYSKSAEAGPVAIIAGDVLPLERTLVCIHSACFLSENLGCLSCNCRSRLVFALEYITRSAGVVIYLRRQENGQGLGDRMRARMRGEPDHLPLDNDDFQAVFMVLADLGIRSVRLLGDPAEQEWLNSRGVPVVGSVRVGTPSGAFFPGLHAIECGLLKCIGSAGDPA